MRASYRQAYSVAYRLTGHASDAEDLLQEAYVRAYRFHHRYDQSMPFLSWLYRIISNSHIDQYRRRGKLKLSSLDHVGTDSSRALEIPDSTYRPDENLLDSVFSDEMQNGLNEMNPEFRMAVVLADIEGMSYDEISEAMGTTVGTVRSRIHRGRMQLRESLLKNSSDKFARYSNEL
jgi:RNA polymerase sigma-70 factor, ECF subfamily